MTSINIIARNNCKLNVNVSGNYTLALTGVTGPYNIVLLKEGRDKLRIRTHTDTRLLDKLDRKNIWLNLLDQAEQSDAPNKEETIKAIKEKLTQIEYSTQEDYVEPLPSTGYISETRGGITNYEAIEYTQIWECGVDSDVLSTYSAENVVALVNNMFAVCLKQHSTWKSLIQYVDSYNKFEFTKCDILSCSEAFSYLLGIPTTGQVGYSETIPIFNGTPYLFLRCNKLNCPLRYCWQTNPAYNGLSEDEKKKKMYSGVQQILSVSPNNNYINNPFSLGGGQITCDGNDLTDVEFTITGIHGEEIEFASDLLWTFELTPVPDEDLSNLPGLLPPEAQQEMAQAQGQEGEQPQQAPQEQQQEQAPEAQQEEQAVRPSSTGLMKTGLPRIQNIQ